MTSTTTDRVALILDCLGHEDTELGGQARLWRHRDGRYLTEEEAAIIEKECTLGEIKRAYDLWHEEVKQLQERALLAEEFNAILRPYEGSSRYEEVGDVIARIQPESKKTRAIEIWQRIWPTFEAWRRDQS